MSSLSKLKNNSLLNSFINLCVIDGINYLLPFLALPFLYRTLGPQVYGVVASAYSFFTFSVIFIDFGFGLSATREVSLNVNNKDELCKIVSSTLAAKIILLTLVLIGSVIVIECTSFREYRSVFYLMMGIPIGSCLFPVWFFQGMEKMSYMTTTTTLAKVLSFVPMFVVVRKSSDVEWVSIFYSIGFIISGIVSIIILKQRFGIHLGEYTWNRIKKTFQSSSPYFLSRVSAALYGLGNTMLIGMFCGTLMAGYYDSAQKLLTVFTAALSPLTTALYPYMIKQKNVKLFRRILYLLGLLGIIIAAVSIYWAADILTILFGSAPETTVIIFRILFLSTAFLIPSYLMGYPFLAALGHVKFTNYTVLIAGLIYLLVAIIAITTNSFTVYVAASLYVICELSVFLLRIYGVVKYKMLIN